MDNKKNTKKKETETKPKDWSTSETFTVTKAQNYNFKSQIFDLESHNYD